MTTLEQLAAIVEGDQCYTLMDRDPLVALSHLHAVARARAVALGSSAVNDVHLATRTVLTAVDVALEAAEPARELPAVFIDGDGDVMLGTPGERHRSEHEENVATACRDLLRDGAGINAKHTTDDLERVRDFLDAAVRARRDHETALERIRTEHAAAIDALRAAGWTVREP